MSASTEENRAILVGNLAAGVTEKELTAFFAFCGPITGFEFRQPSAGSADDVVEAVIQFDTPKAATTALLLTNAIVHDRAIAVTYFRGDTSTVHPPVSTSPGETGAAPVPADKRSHTSVIASLVAAGYVVATDALDHARRMDEGYHITGSLLAAAAVVQQQSEAGYRLLADLVAQFEEKYGIGAKAKEAVERVDESLKVSERARAVVGAVGESVSVSARSGRELIEENEFVLNARAYVGEVRAFAAERTAPVTQPAVHVVAEGRRYVESEIEGVKQAVAEARSRRRLSQEQAADAASLEAAVQGAVSEKASAPEGVADASSSSS